MKKKFGIFLIFTFIFLLNILLTNRIYFHQDLTYLFHPWRTFAAEVIQKGELPLWNPYVNGGMPFLANLQTAIFYPFSQLFYHFSFPLALKIFLFLHFFLAGYLFSLVFGRKKFSLFAGIVAGTVFAFNDYLFLRVQFLSLLGSAIYFPLLYLFLQRRNVILFGLGLALQFFAGYPHILALSLGLLTIFCLANRHFPLKFGLISFLLFLLFTSIQLIPFTELFFHSARGPGISFEETVHSSAPIKNLMDIVYPDKQIKLEEEISALSRGLHIGIFSSLLLFIFLFFGKKEKRNFLLVILLMTMVLALGKFTPWYFFFYKNLFFLKFFRHPGQFIYLTMIVFSFLAGEGAKILSEKTRKTIYILIPIFICLELSFFHRDINPTLNKNYYYLKKEKIKFLQNNLEDYRFFNTFRTLYYTYYYDSQHPFNPVNFRDRIYGFTGLPYHLSTAYGYGEPLEIGSYMELAFAIGNKPTADAANNLLNLLNVKYLFAHYPIDSNNYRLVFTQNDTNIYENKNVLPFVYVTETIYTEESRSTCFPVKDVARINSEVISVAKQIFPAGWLIISENFYPGWRTFVDGKEARLFRANYIFKALPLNAGEHRIRIIYSPKTFRWGLMITVFSFVGLCLFAIIVLTGKPSENLITVIQRNDDSDKVKN